MKICVVAGAAALVLMTAACSSSGGGGTSSPSPSQVSSPAVSSSSASAPDAIPKCGDLVGDPDWVRKLTGSTYGCEKADGNLISSGSFDCKDGAKLFQFSDDGTHYWGVSSSALMKTTAPIDTYAPYRAAYLKCTTGSTANPFSPSR